MKKNAINRELNNLYTRWGKEINKECPLAEYPRPQMKRESWVCLNGVWEYAIIDGKESTKPEKYDGEILVPFSPESLLSGVGRQLKPGQELWYKRKIEFENISNDKKVLLHFGAVDQHCIVYLNGSEAGRHSGGYWPFMLDITDLIILGENSISVCVTDDSDLSNEAYGKQKIERGGIWYTSQSGIWQTVWYEIVPKKHIESIKITPMYRDSAVEIKVMGDALSGIVHIKDGDKIVAQGTLENGTSYISLPDFKSWSPESPFLYDVEITAGDDKVLSYFGMREFGISYEENGYPMLLLNGNPIFHNGLLDQGYWSDGMYTPPADEAMIWEITQIKKMGFNMLRKHIKIEPLRWYYHCDRLGIIVWQDFVSGGGPYRDIMVKYAPWLGFKFSDTEKNYALHGRASKAGRDVFLRDAERTIDLLYNTVSLALWVPFNEGWGQFDSEKVCDMIKVMDPTRQIDHASGYHDQGTGDLESYHIYYKRFRPKHKKNSDRVLALTEFGGYSLPIQHHMASKKLFGYKIFKNRQELQNSIEGLYEKDVLPNISKGLGAIVYTQVSDVEDEINGLFTYDREIVKIDEKKMLEMNKKIFDAFENEVSNKH